MKLLYNETYINNQNVYQIDVPYSWHCKTGNYYPGLNFTDFDEIEVIQKGSFIEYCLNSEYGSEKTCFIFTVCDYLEFVKKGLTWFESNLWVKRVWKSKRTPPKTNSSFVESLYVSAWPRNYTINDYHNVEGAVQIPLYHTISFINTSSIDLLIGDEDCISDTVTAIRAIVHRSVIWLTLVLRNQLRTNLFSYR